MRTALLQYKEFNIRLIKTKIPTRTCDLEESIGEKLNS